MSPHDDLHDDDTAALARAAARSFDLLRVGVPLSLLLDLAASVHSQELMREERADTSWVPRAVA